MLLWGMSFVWTSIALRFYQPITVIFLRLVISAVFMFLFIRATRRMQKIRKEDLKLFLVSALFNPFFYFIGENFGVKLTSPTISAVVIATIPLFVPIASYFLLKEKLSILNIAGLVISFGGLLIMLVDRQFNFETSPLGVGALMFAVLSAVWYSILLKKLTINYSPVFIIAVQNLIGTILFLPVFLIFDMDSFPVALPGASVVASILALAIFCSSLAFVFFTYAMREVGVARVNVFANLIPVFTGIFSYFVVNEMLGSQKILGIVIVVAGLFFAQSGRKGKKRGTIRIPKF